MASSGKRKKAANKAQPSKGKAPAPDTRKQAAAKPAKGKKTTDKKNGKAAAVPSSDGDERPTKKTRRYRTTVEDVEDIGNDSAGDQGTSTSRAQAKASQRSIVVSSDDDDDEHEQSGEEEEQEDDDDDEPAQDEDDEAELGECIARHEGDEHSLLSPSARLQKCWTSSTYAFFKPEVAIEYVDGRRSHVFACARKSCDFTTRRYLDTRDRSTGNLFKHAVVCWGREAVDRAKQTSGQEEARKVIVQSIQKTGRISAFFSRQKKGKVAYSHMQHMSEETR